MGGRWDDKANLKFISLYEQNQCLWKTDSAAYKNRDARERAINRVVEAMAIPDFRNLDCKNKIKNVRSHYIQELKKIKKSRRLSSLGNPTYEPKLAWFAPLDRFLRPHILTLTKAGGGGATQKNPPHGGGEERAAEDTTAWLDASPDCTNEVSAVVDAPQALPTVANTTSPRYFFVEMEDDEAAEDRKPRKRRALLGGGGGDAPPAPPAASSSSQGPDLIVEGQTVNVTPGQKDTEFEAFGRSIAAQLKNMPFSVALQLQLKIQTLITEERLRMLRSPPD